MMIKKYIAKDTEEIQKLIDEEMGPNAVILTSRQIRYKGWRAFFFHNLIEVVAAIDEEDYQTFQRVQQDRQLQQLQEDQTSWEDAIAGIQTLKQRLEQGENPPPAIQEEPDFAPEDFDLLPVERKLIGLGIPLKIASDMAAEVEKVLDEEALKRALAAHIPEAGPIPLSETGFTTVALAGFRGIGKTSLLLKIAYPYFQLGKRVAIVSFGDHPSQDEERLASFCHELHFPYWNCMKNLAENLADQPFDLIFVDIAEITEKSAQELSQIPQLEAHLVLDASMEDLEKLEELEGILPYKAVAFTKCDLAPSLGNILTLTEAVQLPISYLSTGPQIPQDIEIANALTLAEKLLTLPKT